MTAADSVSQRFLRLAARRWPADIRQDMHREWSAEMYAIANQPSGSKASRAFGQLRFAFSLAVSPPAPDENKVPRGWRELLPRWGGKLVPAATLFGVGALIAAFLRAALGFGGMLGETFPQIPLSADVATIGSLVAIVGFVCWLGNRLGRRLPMSAPPTGRLSRAWSVAAAPLSLGAGILVVQAANMPMWDENVEGHPFGGPAGTPLWIAAAIPWLVLAVWATRRGRAGMARGLGAAVGLVIAELATIPQGLLMLAQKYSTGTEPAHPLLWFPMSLLGPGFFAQEHPALVDSMATAPTLVVAGGFLLCYVVSACQVTTARVSAIRVSPPAPAVSPLRTRFALGVMVVGLLAWSVAVGFGNPQALALTEHADSQFQMWVVEIRQAAILLIALSLALGLVGWGRPFLPAVITGFALSAVDTFLDATDREGIAGFCGALGAGAIITVASWWLGRTMQTRPPQAAPVRRAYAGIAITAGLCAPALLFQSTWPSSTAESNPSVVTPAVFPVLTTVLVAMLAAVATVSGLAARSRPASRVVEVLTVAIPVVLLGTAAGFSGAQMDARLPLGVLAGLPFAAFLLTGMRETPEHGRWWVRLPRWVIWAVALLGAAPMVDPVLIVNGVIADPLLTAAGVGYPADGGAYVPGAIVVAICLAVPIAYLVVPPPGPRPLLNTGTNLSVGSV